MAKNHKFIPPTPFI